VAAVVYDYSSPNRFELVLNDTTAMPPTSHPEAIKTSERQVVFISKATPGDDEFVLWLAPKLEAAGYKVFADILTLEPGDRWRSVITSTLQTQSVKMLLCCRDTTLQAQGVLEEMDIATDLAKDLGDARFIVPLRLERYKKIFGIAGLQYIDFVRGWADGLEKLLTSLKRQKVPCDAAHAVINPNWEIYRRRGAITLKNEPERLTSNWLRITKTPDFINYVEPTGAIDRDALEVACAGIPYPAAVMQQGIITFLTADELNTALSHIGRFALKQCVPLTTFVQEGIESEGIKRQDASNVAHSMLRQAWNAFCRQRGLLEYHYSSAVGFHVGKDQVCVGKKIPWGRQGERRSSMLRNIAKGYVWQFGVSALPAFWPFPHLKLKSRVLFAPVVADEAGASLSDPKKQHRLRRTVCKGWRNKQWYGRLRAFVELLSGENAAIMLQLSDSAIVRVEASPMLFSSPVSTILPDQLRDEDEEADDTTLGRPEPDPEDET
jgi:hypothetical protein